MLDLSAAYSASLRMLGAGSSGTGTLCLMLQIPSHVSGLWCWLWCLPKYLWRDYFGRRLNMTMELAGGIWRLSPLLDDLLWVPYCLHCHLRTHLLLILTRYLGSQGLWQQLLSPDQRLHICPELSLTQPKPIPLPTLSSFFGALLSTSQGELLA